MPVSLFRVRLLVVILICEVNSNSSPGKWRGGRWRVLSMLLTLAKRSIIPSSPLSPTHNHLHRLHSNSIFFPFCLVHLSSSLPAFCVINIFFMFPYIRSEMWYRESSRERNSKGLILCFTTLLVVNGGFQTDAGSVFRLQLISCMFSPTCLTAHWLANENKLAQIGKSCWKTNTARFVM